MTGITTTARARLALASAVATLGISSAALPAVAQDAYYGGPQATYTYPDIVITAPRTVGRTGIGAEIQVVRASRVVEFRDLDLSTPWGANGLLNRIRWAARADCDELDYRYPGTLDTSDGCYGPAVRNALTQVRYVTGYDLARW